MVKLTLGKNIGPYAERKFVPGDFDPENASQVESLYLQLTSRPVGSPAELERWLFDWSELESVLSQTGAILYIMLACRTDDPGREKRYLDFVGNVIPVAEKADHGLKEKLVASPHTTSLDKDRHAVLIRDAKSSVAIFRQENVPLGVEENNLVQKYDKTMGAMTVDVDGDEITLQQAARYLEKPDRDIRKEVWEKVARRRLDDAPVIDGIFDSMLEIRARIAANAGFDNYRDYAFVKRKRFDYTVADCERFHDAVESLVVPFHRQLQQRRADLMGLDRLRPWDLAPDPLGRPPLEPFAKPEELLNGCARIFGRINPVFGERFRFLADRQMLDMASRKGKAPGAFCYFLEEYRVPFIFQSAVGMNNDVYTLLHESGHAFHDLEYRDEPLIQYREAPLEFSEVASMSMELLGSGFLDEFYSEEDGARAREQHIESIVRLFCWISTVDLFQHWIYTHPGHSADARAAEWVKLRERFGGIEDWSGYDDERRFEWHRQPHIFHAPFYYIEYGIAQLGALQVWNRYRDDSESAIRDLRKAFALGGSVPLPRLFDVAGIRFDMGRETLAPLIKQLKGLQALSPDF